VSEPLADSTLVVLVRHGLPLVDGSSDPGLSQTGWAQARKLADLLVEERPAAVLSSHLRRARETAAPLAERLGLEVGVDQDLREWESYNPQPYYRPPEALDGSPRLQAYREGRFVDFLPPHDVVGLADRVVGAVRRGAKAHPGSSVVAASHGGAINALVARVVGAPVSFNFDPAYTGVTRVRVMPDGRIVLVSANEAGHLRSLLASP
jgi:2,3-bisphosphoglycerate-dependent phosphoglycerate mutase